MESQPYERLFATLAGSLEPPAGGLAGALAALPEIGTLPPPVAVLTLVAMARHRRRQAWARDNLRARLFDRLPPLEELAPERTPLEGVLRGLPEWGFSLEVELRYCTVFHRVTGEAISVDLASRYGESFFFIPAFLDQTGPRDPGTPEARIQALRSAGWCVLDAVDMLVDAGLVEQYEPYSLAEDIYRLTPAALEHADALAAFGDAWAAATDRTWIAALIGDWPAAHASAAAMGDPAVVAVTSGRVARERALRLARVGEELAGGGPVAYRTLVELQELGAPELPEQLRRAFEDVPDGADVAMEIVDRMDDAAFCPEALRLFRRVRTGGASPDTRLALRCARFLARHGRGDVELVSGLAGPGGEPHEAVLFALEHRPGCALTVIRPALRSSGLPGHPWVVAILALVDRPWSRGELLGVLRGSTDPKATMYIRAALRESVDPGARAAVALWERRHPPDVPEDVGMFPGHPLSPTVALGFSSDCLRDRVMPLRDRTPGAEPLVAGGP